MAGVCCLLCVAMLGSSADAALAIVPGEQPTRVEVIAALTAEEWKSLPTGPLVAEQLEPVLQLSLLDDEGRPLAAIFGSYQRRGDRLVFTPRYQLAAGERYQARLTLSPSRTLVRDYRPPVPVQDEASRPVVERVYPSGDALPANHLKFYIYFSQPMRQGRAIFDQIHLLDEQGNPAPDVWRRTELWTPDARRLTLWIHPGRIKQGVNLREEFGPVLHPDRRYSLRIDDTLQSAAGATMAKAFVKSFRTLPEDARRPLPQHWKITPPVVGGRGALTVEFGEPLDYAMLQRLLTVHTADGKQLAGEIFTPEGETAWHFRPAVPWQGDAYQLRADELLEDLAGNTPVRVFDTDLTQPVGEPARLVLSFRPRMP